MLRYQFSTEKAFERENKPVKSQVSFADQINRLRSEVIGTTGNGRDSVICPLDKLSRSILYADYTASGRSLACIEDFIRSRVLPWYGNTHSVASGTARQTTHYREEARQIIRNYFNCSESNAVVFTGSGVTAAVSKFLAVLEEGIREGSIGNSSSGDIRSYLVEDRWGSLICSLCNVRVKNESTYRSHCHSALHHRKAVVSQDQSRCDKKSRLHFLIDSRSHHSSMLPFRESARRYPGLISYQCVDLDELATVLTSLESDVVPAAVLCAMSNITGEGPTEAEIYSINETVHAMKGIVAWDLATYACHNRFDMNPPARPNGYTDFAFVSSHKLVGGPGASGLLLGRREWMRNRLPSVPGGGVVFFASEAEESYIQNSEEREEAGTPDILACIRAGLVFSLHSRLDMKNIHECEISLVQRLRQRLALVSCITVLGDSTATASPLVSFNIAFESGNKLLHHNFVVAVLNDLFGVQVRGGCACAGPFAQKLLGLSAATTHRFHMCLQQSGQEVFRPGFVRLGVHWTMTEEEVDVLGEAVCWIASNGWRLLSVYHVDLETGEWRHRISNHDGERDWISGYDFFSSRPKTLGESARTPIPLIELVARADVALQRIHDTVPLDSVKEAQLDPTFSDLVWFALPSDSRAAILAGPRVRETPSAPSVVIEAANRPVSAEQEQKKKTKGGSTKKLRSLVTSAIIDYSMINEGDRVLIGISGGKDSLTLLHLLLECQRKCPFKFEIACATVDPQTPEYQPQALVPYIESLGVKYHYLSAPIIDLAKTAMTGKQSICAFCSRMKRGMLYACMRENGYNVLALGQHLDDLAESFLMSCFRNGALSTMKANYFVKDRDLRVIRPLIYVREKMTADFARDARLPIIRDNCPACFAAPKERHRIKMLLSKEEFQNQFLFFSLLQAMRPLIGISQTDEEEDQAAEEILLPCSDGNCPLPKRN